MSNLPPPKETRIIDIVPRHWFKSLSDSSILMVGYRIALSKSEDLKGDTKMLELNGTKAVLLEGSYEYVDSSSTKIDFVNGNFVVERNEKNPLSRTKDGGLLLVFAPLNVDGESRPESFVQDQISSTVGLFVSFFGINVAHQRLFCNQIDLKTQGVSAYSSSILNPLNEAAPNLSAQRFALLGKAVEKVETAKEQLKTKIWLSLHWYDLARASQGVDTLLKAWVAIEVLVLNGETDVSPIKRLLAEAYNLPTEKGDPFIIGQIFGLRSEIVHSGLKAVISDSLSNYVFAVYVDLLFQTLSLPCEKHTLKYLDRTGFNAAQLVREALERKIN